MFILVVLGPLSLAHRKIQRLHLGVAEHLVEALFASDTRVLVASVWLATLMIPDTIYPNITSLDAAR